MAKKRRLKKHSVSKVGAAGKSDDAQRNGVSDPVPLNSGTQDSSGTRFKPNAKWRTYVTGLVYRPAGLTLLSGGVVYLLYYPSDSVAVEQGEALWFALLALVTATVTWAGWFWTSSDAATRQGRLPQEDSDAELASDVELAGDGNGRHLIVETVLLWGPWLLAAWMMVAAFATCPPGNLRMATNEAWLWVSAAAVFSASRLLTRDLEVRRALLALMVVGVVGLSIHGLHQYFVSLPANRLLYQQDPDAVLAMAGIDAPAGSAERMVFANRLMDGGPTATFALANSLAAALLFGVVIAVGVLRYQFRVLRLSGIIIWVLVGLACVGCLLAARSRSATLAMMFAVGLLWLLSGHLKQFRFLTLITGLGVLLAGAVGGGLFLGFFGNREWFEQAPTSLAFRFQYWRASWQMVLEYPLFGVGPGNFQAFYERFRELSTTEQIAEPHNLFIETLASGGFVALGLLGILVVAAMFLGLRRVVRPSEAEIETGKTKVVAENGKTKMGAPTRGIWIVIGATLSFTLVWLIGVVSLQLPDVEASLFVVPVVLGTAFVTWPSLSRLRSNEIDAILLSACVGVCIHLMVAGGWTVPGVAMFLWVGGGTITRCHAAGRSASTGFGKQASPDGQPKRFKVAAYVVGMAGLLACVTLTYYSIDPVETRKTLIVKATDDVQKGRTQKARDALTVAAAADPWSPEALLWLSNLDQLELVVRGDSSEVRKSLDSALSTALERAGEDPAVYRLVGGQRMHLFQRHGRKTDLDSAIEIFDQVAKWSPADEWIMAQMSVLESVRKRPVQAAQYAERARELSVLGGNIERQLSRQLIFVPKYMPAAAQSGPIRRPAEQMLNPLLEEPIKERSSDLQSAAGPE